MEEAPLLGAMSGPDDEMVTDLFCPERPFVPEGLALSPAVGVKLEQDELPVLGDAYLGAADPAEPLLRALSPPPGADCPGEVQAALLGDFPGLPELRAPEDAAPPAYSVHVLSSLLPAPRGPALVPLGAGVRVIPVRAAWGRAPRVTRVQTHPRGAGPQQESPWPVASPGVTDPDRARLPFFLQVTVPWVKAAPEVQTSQEREEQRRLNREAVAGFFREGA